MTLFAFSQPPTYVVDIVELWEHQTLQLRFLTMLNINLKSNSFHIYLLKSILVFESKCPQPIAGYLSTYGC